MKAIYDSAWQHPGIAFAAGLAVLAFLLRERLSGRAKARPFAFAFAAIFLVEIVLDALFTGAFSPVMGTAFEMPIAIAFVILGDYRYFVALERARGPRDAKLFNGGWLVALGWAFIIPVLSTIPQKIWPDWFTISNRIFLVYEAMFFVLALILRVAVLPKRLAGADPAHKRWAERLTDFELVQYALWAIADVVILSGVDAGYLLRIVPNAIYYAAFVPFAYLTAPSDEAPR